MEDAPTLIKQDIVTDENDITHNTKIEAHDVDVANAENNNGQPTSDPTNKTQIAASPEPEKNTAEPESIKTEAVPVDVAEVAGVANEADIVQHEILESFKPQPSAETESVTSQEDDSIGNASTEVRLDISISDRLAGLSLGINDDQTKSNNVSSSNLSNGDTSIEQDSSQISEKPAKSAELARSILAGEISDNSECSVEVEEDENSQSDNQKDISGDVSDEEMYIEDQDEDVEEEEEFHELENEEEKHKTSQESVGGARASSSPPSKSKSPPSEKEHRPKPESSTQIVESQAETDAITDKTTAEAPIEDKKDSVDVKSVPSPGTKSPSQRDTDWADIMLSDIKNPQDNLEKDTTSELPVKEDHKTDGDGDNAEDSEKKDEEKKELDLDEDVKNPQYIPKKGVFYEHDDRSHDTGIKKQSSSSSKKDDEPTEVKESSGVKKLNSQEKQSDNRRGNRRQRVEADRWNHDLFRDEKQKPKSKSELINSYGYDIRHERTSRNQSENRSSRGPTNTDRQQPSYDAQISRQGRDNRMPRQGQAPNRSGERKPRRQNNRGRNEPLGIPSKRDPQHIRPARQDSKDMKPEQSDSKQVFAVTSAQVTVPTLRRDHPDVQRDKNARNDSRGRRQNSRDRPDTRNVPDEKLPPINTVMPPMTTWSNKIEDMVKDEEIRKESPSRNQQQPSNINSATKARSNDNWPQSQPNKGLYQDRPMRNLEDNRHQQHYNSRRYQERDDPHKTGAQFAGRGNYGDRSNQHNQEWRRSNNYGTYAKPNEYEPIKTQTFENSRLSQNNTNRNFRDAREIINESRMRNQQNFQSKVQQGLAGPDQQPQSQRQIQHQRQMQQHQHHLMQQQQSQFMQQQQMLHQHPHQQAPQNIRHQQPPTSQHLSSPTQAQQQPQTTTQASAQQQQQHVQSQQMQTLQNQRQHQHQLTQQAPQTHQHPSQHRQNVGDNMAEGAQDAGRLGSASSNNNDSVNRRPIVKIDAYNSTNMGNHSQQQHMQHSQNHRSLGGPISQQSPSSAGSHLVPSHLGGGGTQAAAAQYYSPSNNSRDSAAAAAALASYGYMPSSHSVMDTSRYHMTSQQLTDHGYMAAPTGQSADGATTSVLHQPGMYTDGASSGGTVANSAYLGQAGSTPTIPVTGAGPPPLAPVPYLQHSQYPPPPYSNPYPQPQHNQQSSPAYPYWGYI